MYRYLTLYPLGLLMNIGINYKLLVATSYSSFILRPEILLKIKALALALWPRIMNISNNSKSIISRLIMDL